MAVINTFHGGEATFAEPVSSLGKNCNTVAVDKELAKARSLSCDWSFPPKDQSKKKREEEAVWSAEAMNACWTSGWKRLEVIGGIEEALEETTAKVDHLVDTKKTADAINAVSFETVTNAARPLLAQRPKDEEEWVVRSRAQVTKLLKQRRDEREEAHRRRSVTAKAGNPETKRKINDKLTEKIGAFRSAYAWQKKRSTRTTGSGSLGRSSTKL